MKTRVLYFAMIAAALTFSCQKAELENNEVADKGNDEVVDFVPGPGKILAVTPTGAETKVAFGDAVDGKYPVIWTNTDVIKVYSENNAAGVAYTYTGEAAEGTSSAVFTGEPVEGETRYAVFPETRAYGFEDGKLKISFDALKKQDFHSSVQANGSNLKYMPMWAKEGKGADTGKFVFDNLCGVVSFRFNDYQELRGMKITSVKIASASKYISGVATLDPADGSFTLAAENIDTPDADKEIVVSRDAGLAIANTNTSPSIEDAGVKGYLIPLPAGEYPAGDLTVTITDSFGRVFTRTVNSPLTVLPGVDKTFKTLSFTFAYGDDNCLVLAPNGSENLNVGMKYTFATNYLAAGMAEVKDAEGKPYGLDSLIVDVAWEMLENGAELAGKGTLISVEPISGNKVKVTSVQNKRGNALIVLKDSKETILWSWHIWVVGENLKDQTFNNLANKPTFHNINLGATTSTFDSSNAIGLYYQYGRKDPFVIAKAIGRPSSSPYICGPELTDMIERTNENAKISWTIKHPGTRIIRTASEQSFKSPRAFGDWCLPQGEAENYWGPNNDNGKTIYDPCPRGYKVPSSSAFANFSGGKGTDKAGFLFNASSYTENELTKEAYNADNIGIAYFPYTGAMLQGKVRASASSEYSNPSKENSLHMYRWRGWYWTTEIKPATETRNDVVLFLDNSSTTLLTATATRASANNIRCVKITSAE